MPNQWLNGLVRMKSKHLKFDACKDDSIRSKQETVSTVCTNGYVRDEVDPEMEAINRFTRRNHRRLLSRTRSSSDIIRDSMLNEVRWDSSHRTVHLDSDHRKNVHIVLDDSAHRGVSLSQHTNEEDEDFCHHSDTRQTCVGMGGTVEQANDNCDQFHSSFEQSSTVAPQPAGLGFGGCDCPLPHIAFPAKQRRNEQQDPLCSKCVELDAQLVEALEDLEDMRKLALRAQRMSQPRKDGGTDNELSSAAVSAVGGAVSMPGSSKQPKKVTTSHQEAEQSAEDGIWLRQEMHLKLNKYARICQGLNDESEALNSECMSLREDLARVQGERDNASQELLLLRADAAQVREQRAEMEQQQKRAQEVERMNVDLYRALQSRDAVIDELACRLNLTLQQLELEREQRQQQPFQFPLGT